MQAHTTTHNLWLWPKRPPLAFSVAQTSAPPPHKFDGVLCELAVAILIKH